MDNLSRHVANRTLLYANELRIKHEDTIKLEQEGPLLHDGSRPTTATLSKAKKKARKKQSVARPKPAATTAFLKWTTQVGAATSDDVRGCNGTVVLLCLPNTTLPSRSRLPTRFLLPWMSKRPCA